MNEKKGLSTSRFILPFIYNGKKKESIPFLIEDWKKYSVSSRYLVHSVYELFSDNSEQVCGCYSLNDSARSKYNIPARWVQVTMNSKIPAVKGEYQFYLSGHRIIRFASGIGFLVLEVQYQEDNIDRIADVSFCISNVFTNEHDGGEKENNLEFSYYDGGNKVTFSIKNTLIDLLQGQKFLGELRLFPSSFRKRLIAYHSIIGDKGIMELDKYLYCLSNSLHTKIKYDESIDRGICYSSFANQKWNIGSNGVTSYACMNEENRDFVSKVHRRNVDMDYFMIFILALHGREIMLDYNHYAIREHKNAKNLIKIKKELLEADILYSFNTISTEASYQEFYKNLSVVFNLYSLRSDIRDVIENVENHSVEKKERKVNTVLTALSMLAIFSVLTDGIGFADRIQSGSPFGVLQWMVIFVVCIILCFAIWIISKKN